MAVLIFLWLVCGAITAYITDTKGRGPWVGLAAGLLIGPLGMLICLCAPKTLERKAEELTKLQALMEANREQA